jgi:primosomal protein N'
VTVGGVDAVKDLGVLDLDLVAILHADASLRRPGLATRERALVAWFEAASWAAPGGRVILQSSHPNDPAVQALVTGRPSRFHRAEAPRLAQAGFPVGCAVFRVAGTPELEAELEALAHRSMLVSSLAEATVCLVALDPSELPAFGSAMRRLAERGVVSRVEADPHL